MDLALKNRARFGYQLSDEDEFRKLRANHLLQEILVHGRLEDLLLGLALFAVLEEHDVGLPDVLQKQEPLLR